MTIGVESPVSILEVAKATGDKYIEEALNKSREIMSKAQEDANEKVIRAERERDEILKELGFQKENLIDEINRLRIFEIEYKKRLKELMESLSNFYESNFERVERAETEDEGLPSVGEITYEETLVEDSKDLVKEPKINLESEVKVEAEAEVLKEDFVQQEIQGEILLEGIGEQLEEASYIPKEVEEPLWETSADFGESEEKSDTLTHFLEEETASR